MIRRTPKKVRIAFNHAGLTHYGGIWFFQEFLRVLQWRRFLTRHLHYARRNLDYTLAQMILSLIYPILLGLDRLQTTSFLQTNGAFLYLTGLQSYPDPQSLRRFLRHAPQAFRAQVHRLNDRLRNQFVQWPHSRSRLIWDWDSTVVTVYGQQEGAEVGYNRRDRGRRSYHPLLGMEANSTLLWDAELRAGNTGTWTGFEARLDQCLAHLPTGIREVRVRADAGFGYHPVLAALAAHPVQYAVAARFTKQLQRCVSQLSYTWANPTWEIASGECQLQGWPQARPLVVVRKAREEPESQSTLFALGPYLYRAWVHNLPLTPAGVWHFYDGRAEIEPRIHELRQDFALRHIPTQDFAANALYLELLRLAYNLVTAFQQTCLPEDWQSYTLSQLRYHLFCLAGEVTRPHNRPTLRFAPAPALEKVVEEILGRIEKLNPLED